MAHGGLKKPIRPSKICLFKFQKCITKSLGKKNYVYVCQNSVAKILTDITVNFTVKKGLTGLTCLILTQCLAFFVRISTQPSGRP